MRNLTAAVLSLAVLACSETPTNPELPISSQPPPNLMAGGIGISGTGTNAGLNLTVTARLAPDGSTNGVIRRIFAPPVLVADIVPPSGGVDYWCVSGPNPFAPAISASNVYIRDIGDGKSTFDEVAVAGIQDRSTPDCSHSFDPTPHFRTLSQGDYKGRL